MLDHHLCSDCDQRLLEATTAMRHHGSIMSTAIDLARKGGYTQEEKEDWRIKLTETFNDAQSAWDAYREHLIEHGFLPAPK